MLKVAGTVPFTMIDFPEHLAAVIFFQGCPLRCLYCHNPGLQCFRQEEDTSWADTLEFLKTRTGRLDGVVLSGGEPLAQKEITTAAKALKDMGFKVALHTAGVHPDRLSEILPLIDWVGLDIKAPWEKYDAVTGMKGSAPRVQESLQKLIDSGVSFEVRTTCDPRCITPEDVAQIGKEMSKIGVQTYALQKYRIFDEEKNPPSVSDICSFFCGSLEEDLKPLFKNFIVR